jgi:hypothetical protein
VFICYEQYAFKALIVQVEQYLHVSEWRDYPLKSDGLVAVTLFFSTGKKPKNHFARTGFRQHFADAVFFLTRLLACFAWMPGRPVNSMLGAVFVKEDHMHVAPLQPARLML